MMASLRDAKARLSELVQKAANGEEVVIDDRIAWAAELAKAARAAAVDPDSTTDQKVWDDLREDRV